MGGGTSENKTFKQNKQLIFKNMIIIIWNRLAQTNWTDSFTNSTATKAKQTISGAQPTVIHWFNGGWCT